jgi:hydroxymethylbilane synthase
VALTLEANCQSPVATYAAISGDRMSVTALVALPDGSQVLRESVDGSLDAAEDLGHQLADKLLGMGAAELLEQAAAHE